MVKCWVFSLRSKGNIHKAAERLLWGFWDRNLVRSRESKLVRNWRHFLRLYNTISNGDIVFFQMARTWEVHALGIVKGNHYDDQTPILDLEFKNNRVLFPWRVSFFTIIYSEEPFARHFTEIRNYIDGYGGGEIPYHEAKQLLNEFEKKYHLNVNISF